MPRLLGFTPTKKMLEAQRLVEKNVVHTHIVLDITHDGPILETIQHVEIPTLNSLSN
jgi:hypothetical protein